MRSALSFGLLLALFAASAPDIVRGEDKAQPPKVRTLRRGATCDVRKPQRVAVTDADKYLVVWNSIFGGGPRDGRPMPPPAVDFQKEMVLAAFMGERNTGGYSVEIKDAVEEKGKLVVTVLEKSPGPDSIVTQAITNPFHVVALKRSALPVHWKVVTSSK